ncbi:putative repeat protein (TIGR01451 family)/predicted secreted protein (Por secretion system target), partial [Nonlabens xylanidelens]
TLDFEEDFMNLLSSTPTAATPATNQLSWSVSNLQPFQMEEFLFTMTMNTPIQTTNPLNDGDVLTFTGVVIGTGTDAMPADNTMVFDQTVVNSYDPNDKTCLEGKTIDPADVGEYVHYMIRFENTGTASAVNIVVKDEIDLAQFDITTLIPLGGSHDYYTRVRDTNVVEFIHENINLDFNDATNDGYVLFKIKTLSTLVTGDTFDNTADIFFDFNAPIVTNTEVVTIMTPLSISETTDTSIKVYPNPATSFMNLTAANRLESFTIVDINGRMLSQNNFTGNGTEQRISLENLSAGIYFVTIQSEVGQKVEKLIVK